MKNIHPAVGTYALVNVRYGRYALDTKDGLVVTYPYNASESQQWKLDSADGRSWTIQNVRSGCYLGLPVDKAPEHIREPSLLREVNHPFTWQLKPYETSPNQFIIYAPYSKHVVAMNPKKLVTRNSVYIQDDGEGPHQGWHFSKDLHLAACSTLKNGARYKILNAYTRTIVTVKDENKVDCYHSHDFNGQKFRVVETENGWAFQNVHSQRYLGLPYTVANVEDDARLSTVTKPFTWMVIPHHNDKTKFKICLPFTSRLLHLHCGLKDDGTPIHIFGTTAVDWIWWKFELCIEPPLPPPVLPVRSRESIVRHVTGPRDQPNYPPLQNPSSAFNHSYLVESDDDLYV